MRNCTVVVLMFTAFCLSAFAASDGLRQVQSTRFSEVEISLDDNFTLSDAHTLPRAPGSEIQVLDDGRKVKTQLPQKIVQDLIETGADVTVMRNFILMRAANNDIDPNEIIPAETSPAYGERGDNIPIPYDTWTYSDISFLSWPSEILVTTVDVHYKVYGSSGFVYLDFSDEDYDVFTYILLDGVYSDGALLSDTITGITDFAGKSLSQYWILWAVEDIGDGSGVIDYWWVKLYYGGYCAASGGCDEYINRVEFDTIDNSSGCDGYADYTSISNQMMPLDTEFITVTNGNPYSDDECGIWIDWNQDEDFNDAGETINVLNSPGPGPYFAPVTPSFDVSTGDTRMRVRITYNKTPTACGIDSYGEVEDYTITIGGPLRIGGHVLTSWGVPMPDMNVVATTGENDFTDANGYYELLVQGPFQDCIKVSSQSVYWTFDPYQYCLLETEDTFDIDFTGNYIGDPEPVMSGYIKTSEDYPISDVLVEAEPGDSTYTDLSGYYEITISTGDIPVPWTGTITPSKDNWFFFPPNWPVYGAILDSNGLDFTGTYLAGWLKISGYVITDQGYGIPDVNVSASTGESTTTVSGGYYELLVTSLQPWSGTVTPNLDYWDFAPASHSYSNLAADINDQDFVGTYTADPHPTISGYIKTANGTPVQNVHVALDDLLFGGVTMTDEDGYYELSPPYYELKVPRPWSCTIEPAKTDWTFAPPNNVYTDLAFDVPDQNYTATFVGTGCDNGWLEQYATVLRSNPHTMLVDTVRDIAVDNAGNFYLTGTGYKADTKDDIITIKYNAQGDILWLSRFNGPANKNDNPEKLLLDGFGHLYVVGTSYVDSSYTDCVIIRYPLDSNVPDWTVYYTQMLHSRESAESAALDSKGNIYLLCRDHDYHMRTIKYIPGVNEPDWVAQYVAPGYDETDPLMVICDESDNIYVIGENDLGIGVSEWVTIRYDSKTGTPLWTKTYQYGPDSRDMPEYINVFEDDNVYVTGYSMPADGNDRMVAVIYDQSGNVIGHKRLEDPFSGYSGNIILDAQANAYAAGTFGPDNVDIGLIKYLPDSNDISWVARYDSPEHRDDILVNLVFDQWGNIYLLGFTNTSTENLLYDVVVLKYAPDSNQPLAVASYEGPFNNIYWPARVAVDRSHNVFIAASSLGGFLAVKYSQCCSQSDIDCDYEVGRDDLGYLCDEWLMNEISLDIAPPGGDGTFDFLDWAAFADAWYSQFGQTNYSPACDLVPDGNIDKLDLGVLLDNWLDTGHKYLWADIYPQPDGDGFVDVYDFALFAQQWMLEY